jgi:hypothetical protein
MTEQIQASGGDDELRKALRPWSPEPSIDTTRTLAESTAEIVDADTDPLRGANVGAEAVSTVVTRGDDTELRALSQGVEARGDDTELRAQSVVSEQQVPPQSPTPEA